VKQDFFFFLDPFWCFDPVEGHVYSHFYFFRVVREIDISLYCFSTNSEISLQLNGRSS
jgi:hypothetical protein